MFTKNELELIKTTLNNLWLSESRVVGVNNMS